MRSLILSIVLLTISIQACLGQLPYIVAYEDISEELKEIWHDQASGKTYLITTDRLCIMEPGDLSCRSLGMGKNLLFHNQTYDRYNPNPIFLGNYGEFYTLENEKLKEIDRLNKFPNAAIYQDGETTWIAEYKIYKIDQEGNTDTIPIIMNGEIPYWDIRKSPSGDLWFVNYASGIYKIDQSNTLRRVSNLNGLPTNKISCIHIDEANKVYVGYAGGFSIIQEGKQIDNYSLKSNIGNDKVKEFETDGKGNLWFISDKKLGRFNLATKKTEIIPTNANDDFVIHTVEYNPNQELMLIGTSKGLYISSAQGSYFHGAQRYSKGPLYYFGDELLISGKNKVEKFDQSLGDFVPSEHRVIKAAFPDEQGNFWIEDSRDLLFLDKAKKEVGLKIRKPFKNINQVKTINDIVYVCHDRGIHKIENKRSKALVIEEEAFYNVLHCGDRIYALSEQGIYLVEDEILQHHSLIDPEVKMLKSNKQFFIDDKSMLIPSQKSIVKVTCEEESVDFQFYPTVDDILDFHFSNQELFILHADRLIIYDRSAFLKDPYKAKCVIPVNAQEGSKIFIDDASKIWLQSESGLAFIGEQHDQICNILKSDLLKDYNDLTDSDSNESAATTGKKTKGSAGLFAQIKMPYLIAGITGLLLILLVLKVFSPKKQSSHS